MKKLAALTLSLFLTSGIAFADSPKDADSNPAKNAPSEKAKEANKSDKSDSAIAAEIEELRQTLQSQQEQLQLLKEELAKRDRQIDEAREAAAAANSRASEASVKASEAVTTSNAARSASAAISSNAVANSSAAPIVTQPAPPQDPKSKPTEDGPSTIRYKGVSLTPGGFLAAETVYRSRATSGDIATPFTSDPFSALDLAHVSENAFTGRQSRISLLAESKIGSAKASGYYEADFLGAGTTSNNRQTNSYVFRQRQLWAQAALDSGFTFTGGQMWSLVTETRNGVDNRTEATTQTIDAQYNSGFSWARQYGFRVTKNISNKVWLGFAVEDAQATGLSYQIGSSALLDGLDDALVGLSAGESATFQTTRLTGAAGYKYHRNVPIDLVCASAGQGSSREAAVGGCGPTAFLEKRCSRCRDQ